MPILRIPRSDDQSSFVLLNISSSSSDHSLAAKVVGTDGVGAFVLQLKPVLADRARASKAACSPEEWTAILKAVLLDGLVPEDVEVTATAEEEVSIHLVFRKAFEGGLKQRLGSLTLKYDEDEAIELLDWCASIATHAADQARDLERQKEKVRKLVKETDDLVRAKEEAEKEMIGKCMRLINAKKDKIAQLQGRLSRYEKGNGLSGEPMQVDEQQEDAEQLPKKGRGKASAAKGKEKEKEVPAKSTLPRRGKRAAPEPEPESEEVEEPAKGEKDDDEGMDLDEDDVETEGEDTQSDHSLEEEAPEVRRRSESQSQSQNRSQRKTSPPAIEHEEPHVTTLAASHSQTQTQSQSHEKAGKAKDHGSETESDDEL